MAKSDLEILIWAIMKQLDTPELSVKTSEDGGICLYTNCDGIRVEFELESGDEGQQLDILLYDYLCGRNDTVTLTGHELIEKIDWSKIKGFLMRPQPKDIWTDDEGAICHVVTFEDEAVRFFTVSNLKRRDMHISEWYKDGCILVERDGHRVSFDGEKLQGEKSLKIELELIYHDRPLCLLLKDETNHYYLGHFLGNHEKDERLRWLLVSIDSKDIMPLLRGKISLRSRLVAEGEQNWVGGIEFYSADKIEFRQSGDLEDIIEHLPSDEFYFFEDEFEDFN